MLNQLRVDELLAAIGERTPAPASGAATALTAALAAALAELSARFAGDETDAERAHTLAAELVRLGDEDAAAYAAFMTERNDETRAAIGDTYTVSSNVVNSLRKSLSTPSRRSLRTGRNRMDSRS